MHSVCTRIFVVAVLFTVATLSGCATAPPGLTYQYRTHSIPDVGKIHTQNLGESLIRQLSSTVEPAVYSSNAIEFSDRASPISTANKTYVMQPEYFRLHDTGRRSVEYLYSGAVAEGGESSELKACLIRGEDDFAIELSHHPCGSPVAKVKSKELPGVSLTDTTYTVVDDKYFRQELIYNGRNDSSVKFIYREYVDNTARPAFTQSVEYDLSLGDEVGFMEARFRVIEATNTEITYEVLNGFEVMASL